MWTSKANPRSWCEIDNIAPTRFIRNDKIWETVDSSIDHRRVPNFPVLDGCTAGFPRQCQVGRCLSLICTMPNIASRNGGTRHVCFHYFGNFGRATLIGLPVRALRKAMRSAFSSAVRSNGLTIALRLGLGPPPWLRKSTTSSSVAKAPSCI